MDKLTKAQITKLKTKQSNSYKKSVPFELSHDSLHWPEKCPVLGIPIDYFSKGKIADASPSFDRINPRLGYVLGNVRIISQRANRIKNDGTIEEHIKVVEYMRKVGAR